MSSYPSCAVEKARTIAATKNNFPTLFVLSDLSKRKLPTSKKIQILNALYYNEADSTEKIIAAMEELKYENLLGIGVLTFDQQRLGVGPDGKYRHTEYLTGILLERLREKRFIRYYWSEDYDFIANDGTYDVVGPVPPYYFKSDEFLNAFDGHLQKQGLDHVVVCTVGLPSEFQAEFQRRLDDLDEFDRERVILLREEDCSIP